MIRFYVSLSLAAAVLSGASAAQAACVNEGDLVCGRGGVRISSPGNELQVSRGGEFTPLTSGSSVRGGERVLAGAGGGTLTLGPTCQIPVGAGTLVSIVNRGGNSCASLTSPEPTPADLTTLRPEVGVIAVGTAAAAGIAALATSRGESRAAGISAQ